MAQIYTSYFGNVKNLPSTLCPICISGKPPDGWNGAEFKVFAPKYDFFKVYKETHDKEYYIKHFNEDVLAHIDARDSFNRLKSIAGDKIPCMICYEKPNDFCHRHLVAKWLEDNLGIEVKEYQKLETTTLF